MYTLMKRCAAMLMFMVFFGLSGIAQPVIELVLDPQPDSDSIALDSDDSEIWVEARVNDRGMSLEWSLEGPGNFQPIAEGFGGIYTLPETLTTSSATISIRATGTTQQGNSVSQTLELELLAPAPTPTPQPTPTPPPTPTPAPISIERVFLHQNRFYVTPGETVDIAVALDNPSKVAVDISCTAIKGEAECSSDRPVRPLLEIRYTAPDTQGKDMLEVQLREHDSGKSERVLVKIEVLPK